MLAGSFQVLSTYVMKLFFGLYDCSGKLISPVLAGSFQVLYTYVMKLFFGLYDGFPWKSIRRDADSGNIW